MCGDFRTSVSKTEEVRKQQLNCIIIGGGKKQQLNCIIMGGGKKQQLNCIIMGGGKR